MAQYQTYRLSKVPFGTSNEVVRSWFPHENVRNISCATSLEYEYGCETPTCVLTVTFVGLPASLSKLKPTGPGIYLADVVHNDLGSEFAPLNDVKNTVEFVNIVAVTGLGGRAFGSWQCVEDGSMWLQDALPRAIPNARVIIYGDTNSHATLQDFTIGFLRALQNIVPPTYRPLILIGHSLGGMIVKDSWVRCFNGQTDFNKDLRRAIYAIAFFGTPHSGMRADELIEASLGEPSASIPQDLAPGSGRVRELQEGFAKAIGHIHVLSCYELRETPTLVKTDRGTYQREGPEKLMVTRDSACLHWSDTFETKIPLDHNHSQIAKLATTGENDKSYQDVVGHLRRLVKEALEQIPIRFLTANISRSINKSRALVKFLREELIMKPSGISSDHEKSITAVVSRIEEIQGVLSDDNLRKAFFGGRTSRDYVTHFDSKTEELEGCFLQFEPMAIQSSILYQKHHSQGGGSNKKGLVPNVSLFEPQQVSSVLSHAIRVVDFLMRMLSITMLGLPSLIDSKQPGTLSEDTSLARIAAMQALVRSPSVQPLLPLDGTLDDFEPPQQGLHVGVFKTSTSSPRHVLVEYKQYAALRDGRVVQDLYDKSHVKSTKLRAQELASLLQSLALSGSNSTAQNTPWGHSRAFDATTYTLPCLGYLDLESRGCLAFIFQLPVEFIDKDSGKLKPTVRTLKCAIEEKQDTDTAIKGLELEHKFKLAFHVCSTVTNLQSSGWLHKSIRSDNILLFPHLDADGQTLLESTSRLQTSLGGRRYEMCLKGFEFSRETVGKSDPFESTGEENLYLHPERQDDPSRQFTMEYDLYALGLVLFEIGTGKTLEKWASHLRQKENEEGTEFPAEKYRQLFMKQARKRLPALMGSRYANAVLRCIEGTFGVDRDGKQQTSLALAFQQEVMEEVAQGTML